MHRDIYKEILIRDLICKHKWNEIEFVKQYITIR